ncbi:MAG: protein kinase [Gemmatimonadetes bacterium]|nr:protein kinase [Gemmatimonadota bacterium]
MAGIEGLLAGHTLAGRYRIDEVIGRGGFAAVYRAQDERLQRMVAVKVVMVSAPDEDARERIRSRFHREARVAAQLQHRNVVTIFDYGTDDKLGLDFLVMEVLHGEDLAARVARLGPPPLDLSLRILREAAEGLAAGHQAGLVHRDVKPGNIFLEEKNGTDVFRVCVVDFGIAEILEGDETVTSLTRGRMPLSPAYAAPEHLRDERPLTRATDVFGLGVIGYELLTGARLFQGSSPEADRRSIPSLRARNPEVPAGVAAVIEKALAYGAVDRYSDAGELAQALAAAQAEHEVPVEPAAPPLPAAAPLVDEGEEADPEPSKYRARRHPRLPDEPASSVPASSSRRSMLPLLLGLGLILLVALGWWAMARRGSDEAPVAAVTNVDSAAGPGAPGAIAGVEPVGGLDPAMPSAATPPPASAPVAGTPQGAGPFTGAPPATPAAGSSATGGRSAAALHAEGLRLFGSRSFADAVARLQAAADLAPANASYRNDLGWALYEAGQYDAAARELSEVLRLDPRRAIAHANLGEVRLAQGDTAAAIEQYENFLRLNSDPRREAIARQKLERIGNRE